MSALPRNRITLFALSVVTVACGAYLLHRHHSPVPQGSLHRSNAIRRTGSHRRRRGVNNEDAAGVRRLERLESDRVIANLRERENTGSTYGDIPFSELVAQLDESAGRTAPVHCVLIPSRLPRVDELVQRGYAEPAAAAARNSAESHFILAFLFTEIPSGVTVTREEAEYLSNQLEQFQIPAGVTLTNISRFNESAVRPSTDRTPLRPLLDLQTAPLSQHGAEDNGEPTNVVDNFTEVESQYGWRDGGGHTSSTNSGQQDMLTLLYHIAEDNAKKEHIIHRGVQCNGCSMMPLRGVRYRCSNCPDYDLCESCESMQVHIKTHVFYKIRIPTPLNTGSKQPIPVWYPGKPYMMQHNPSYDLMKKLVEQTGFEHSQLETFWEQFRVIAATEWADDPDKIGVAIDRKTFDRAFLPGTATRPPPPNLIFDRLFAFYDVNGDEKIGFTEFVQVQACLEEKTRDAKLRRIFSGYDLNGDGFIDRRDFLRMFRAWYALKREYVRDVLGEMQDDAMQSDLRDTFLGTQPISAAFQSTIHPGHDSREGEGKQLQDGDLVIVDNDGILQEDVVEQYDRSTLVHDLEYDRSRNRRDSQYWDLLYRLRASRDLAQGQFDFLAGSELHWPPPPPFEVAEDDVKIALGAVVPWEEVMDPVDRHRVYWAMLDRWNKETEAKAEAAGLRATVDRWHRREFYTDVEEGVTKPMGAISELDPSVDSEDDVPDQIGSTTGSRPLSPRSRSSSKVRFEDSITDTDYETRSNTSQRSIPIGERWGGYEITEAEKDVGKDVLYLAVSEGFNELLDEMFLEKEDAAMRAAKTRKLRAILAKELQEYEATLSLGQNGTHRDQTDTAHEPRQRRRPSDGQPPPPDLAFLLERSGYAIDRHDHTESNRNSTIPFPDTDHQSAGGTSSAPHHDTASSTPPDPTLPQNRPNSPSLEQSSNLPPPSSSSPPPPTTQTHPLADPSLGPTNHWDDRRHHHTQNHLLNIPPGVKPSEDVLKWLLEDEKTDREAAERGGHGRINLKEFEQKMVPEAYVGTGEGDKVGVGGMRKLEFAGAWIDMAGFF